MGSLRNLSNSTINKMILLVGVPNSMSHVLCEKANNDAGRNIGIFCCICLPVTSTNTVLWTIIKANALYGHSVNA